eukprot:Em0020g216a
MRKALSVLDRKVLTSEIHAPTPLARASTSTCQSSGESGLDKEMSLSGGSNSEDAVQQVTESLSAVSLKEDAAQQSAKSSSPASSKNPAPSSMNESMFAATVGKERIAFNGFSEAKAVLPLTLACQMFAQFAEHLASNSEPGPIHMNFAERFHRDIGKRYRLEYKHAADSSTSILW